MASLVLMMGVPGSGKTTYAKKMMKDCDIYVSRDEIRFGLVKEDEQYFSKEDEVLQTFIKTIDDSLLIAQRYVIADATHLNEKSRDKVLNRLNLENVTLCAVNFIVPLEECIRRNDLREGRAKVPRSVIRRMYFSFIPVNITDKRFSEIINVRW